MTRKIVATMVCGMVMGACSVDVPSEGERLFQGYCQRCHGASMKGNLVQIDISARTVWREHPDSLIGVLLFGSTGERGSTQESRRTMPPVPYNSKEIAVLTEYLMQTVANRTVEVTAADVDRVRKNKRSIQTQISLEHAKNQQP